MHHPQTTTIIRRGLRGLAAALGVAMAVAACSGDPLPAPTATGETSAPPDTAPVIVGAADFPENRIIAEIYAGALNAAGITASTGADIGSRETYLKAVQDGAADVVPSYSGSLLSYVDPDAAEASAEEVFKALQGKLPEGLAVLEPAKAESKDAMVVTKATAEKYQAKSIEDLAPHCPVLILAAPATFETAAHGLPGLEKNYGCKLKEFKPLPDGADPLTLQALLTDQVQVANIPTSSPDIEDHALVVLEDPKGNFKAQQVLPLYNPAKMTEAANDALNAVSRVLTTQDLVDLNRAVSGSQKQDVKEAAAGWLQDKGMLR